VCQQSSALATSGLLVTHMHIFIMDYNVWAGEDQTYNESAQTWRYRLI
jgi:hypothetical protein